MKVFLHVVRQWSAANGPDQAAGSLGHIIQYWHGRCGLHAAWGGLCICRGRRHLGVASRACGSSSVHLVAINNVGFDSGTQGVSGIVGVYPGIPAAA